MENVRCQRCRETNFIDRPSHQPAQSLKRGGGTRLQQVGVIAELFVLFCTRYNIVLIGVVIC